MDGEKKQRRARRSFTDEFKAEVVKRVLTGHRTAGQVARHSDPAITANVYGNIGMDDLRDAVNVLGDRVKLHLVEGGATAPDNASGDGASGSKTGAKGD